MKKRVVSILLTAAMAAALASPALADAYDVPQAEKAAVLRELEVMVGDETGALHLERGVTRSEFTKLLIAASPYKDAVGEAAGTDPYPDVSHTSWYAPYVRTAVDCGLVKGDEQGWFHPDDPITLREGATMAVRLLGYQDSDFNSPWPAGQMALLRSLDLDAGLSARDGLDALTRQDCLHLFYNLLCAKNKSGQDHINLLGSILNQDGEVDVAALFKVEQEGPIPLTGDWQSLLPFSLNDALIFRDGERVERSELREWDLLYWAKDAAILLAVSGGQGAMGQLTASVEGPVVAEGNWQGKLPFALSAATPVTRNGARSSVSAITGGEVVYWSKYAKALYVYDKTVTGTVEAIAPSLAAPTSVTIAGVPYTLETLEAQYAFSDLGTYRKGDPVRLLLGRTGGAAAVRSLGESDSVVQVGVVSALESRSYTDENDKPYASKVIVLTAADGQSYAYPYPWKNADDYKSGDLVQVKVQNGATTVTRLGRSPVTGTVNAAGTRLGSLTLSPDVEILDTYGDHTARAVSPARLANVKLSANMVRWHQLDDSGAITALILDDVTGDSHSYGVLTDVETVSIPATGMGTMTTQGLYTMDLGGRQQVLPVSGKRFPVEKGPFCLAMDGQEVKEMRSLYKLANVTLDGQDAVAGGQRWPLADGVVYYTYNRSGAYALASRGQVLSSGWTLSAWYDRQSTDGGRVRVIVAQEK